jgi:hypothetical protein
MALLLLLPAPRPPSPLRARCIAIALPLLPSHPWAARFSLFCGGRRPVSSHVHVHNPHASPGRARVPAAGLHAPTRARRRGRSRRHSCSAPSRLGSAWRGIAPRLVGAGQGRVRDCARVQRAACRRRRRRRCCFLSSRRSWPAVSRRGGAEAGGEWVPVGCGGISTLRPRQADARRQAQRDSGSALMAQRWAAARGRGASRWRCRRP